MKEIPDIYPLTIVVDRYGGCYSGASFLAFNCYATDIPHQIGSDDTDEGSFWGAEPEKGYIIGKGETPNDACFDLYAKLNPTI